MKKNFLRILLFLAALSSLSACSNKSKSHDGCGETCTLGGLKKSFSNTVSYTDK